MKKILIILSIFLFNSLNIFAECSNYCLNWNEYFQSIALVEFNDIALNNDEAAWVVGNYGTILNTTDGFYSTVFQVSNTYENLLSISMVSNDSLWISGNNGIILKTTNGGIIWSQYITNLTDNITCIDFVNANVGWAIGSNGNILRTYDAGENWEIFSNIEFQGIKRIFVVDENNAWGVGNDSKIIKLYYNNNDISVLNQSPINLSIDLNDLCFIDLNNGWVVGDSCTCLKTNDGGNTWVSIQTNEYLSPATSFNKISFLNQNFGYVTTSEGIIYTGNGGSLWGFLERYNSLLKGVCMIDEYFGYTIDSEGSVFELIGDYCYYTYCLNTPTHGSTNVSVNPVLTWELIWGNYTYYIEVATDSLFENIISYEYNQSGFNYQPGPLEYNTKYYWRMKLFEEGIWSDVWSFTTEPENPVAIDIPLNIGWNMISSNVIPTEPAIENVFEDMSNIVLVKNGAGQIYSPVFGINEIGDWNIGAGYYVYTNGSSILNISGAEVIPSQQGIELNAGWNLVSYLRNSPMNVQQSLLNISSNLIIAKNNSGGFYHPGFGINTLGDMQPGQGYWLYMNAPAVLTYPGN